MAAALVGLAVVGLNREQMALLAVVGFPMILMVGGGYYNYGRRNLLWIQGYLRDFLFLVKMRRNNESTTAKKRR